MVSPARLAALALGTAMAVALVPPAWSSTPGPSYSWGSNQDGRLGTGASPSSNAPAPSPMDAQGTPGRYTAIAAGANHGCAIGPDGSAYCWGNNRFGQLGDGTNGIGTTSSIPVDVNGGRTFSYISAGNFVSCALDDTHNAFCWGSNLDGQLGIGTTDDSAAVPVAVAGGRAYSTISSGIGDGFDSNTCAVTTDDTAYCWGPNSSGQLGNIAVAGSGVPVPVSNFTNRTTDVGLASNSQFGVYAVGSTVYSATTLGLSISTDGGATFTNRTTADGLGSDIVLGVYAVGSTVYAATWSGLAISTDGGATFTNCTTADGLGDNVVLGAYVEGSTIYAATHSGLSISTDGGTTFTNRTTGNGLGSNNVMGVYAVGSTVYAATYGGLSISTDGGATFTNRTTADALGSNFVDGIFVDDSSVYAATAGGLAISTDGGATFTNRTTADGLTSDYVTGVYAAGSTLYVASATVYAEGGLSISTDGGSTFTGYTASSGLGSNDVRGVYADDSIIYAATYGGGLAVYAPTYDYVDVSVGGAFACAIKRGSGATGPGYCWGDDAMGQLGRDDTAASTGIDRVPQPIARPAGAGADLVLTSIAAGRHHACALSTDDSVYCWGSNASGQLGINSTDDSVAAPTLVAIPDNAPVRDLSAGRDATCATTDDTMYCWGSNSNGQLGTGTSGGNSPIPVAVTASALDSGDSPTQVTSGEAWNAFIARPRMVFSPVGFPAVSAGSTVTMTVSVTNNRAWPVTIASSGATGAGLTVMGGTCTPGTTVAPGATCTVDLSWRPTVAGPLHDAALTVAYTGNSSTTPLSGTATSAARRASPPRNVSGVAGAASATVSWAVPASQGSSPVSSYAVTSSPGGRSCLTGSLTCEVTGLRNGTTYTFTVRALNSAGWSAESQPSNSVTPRPSGQPSISIVGSRSADGSRVQVRGTTRRLVGISVRPWFRFPGETSYAQGAAIVTVDSDGRFTWSRKANKRIYVYFAQSTIKSNRVIIAAP